MRVMNGDSMSEDLTKKPPKTDSDKLSLILTIVENLDTRLEKLEQRLDAFEERLDHLETKVADRLYDTRPIWHKVVGDIAQLQEGQTRLEVSIREISIKLDILNNTMLTLQARH